MKIKTSICAIAALFAVSVVGCGEAERTYDCAKICDKYAECFNDQLDNSECVDKCEDAGDRDDSFETKASKCEECLDDAGSCADKTLSCATQCGEVVLVSTSGNGAAGAGS